MSRLNTVSLAGGWRDRLATPGRYLSTGLLCAVIQNAIVILFSLAEIHYAYALTLSVTINTPLAYYLHSLHTFGVGMSWKQFFRFTAGLGGSIFLSFAAMAVLCDGMRVHPAIAAPMATVLVCLWGYISAYWAIKRGAATTE